MTEAHKKFKIALIEQGLTFRDASNGTGLAQTVISNTLSGRTANRRTQQALTNWICLQLWPDVEVTDRVVTFNKLQPGAVVRRGRVVSYTRPISVTVEVHPKRNPRARNRKISASSSE